MTNNELYEAVVQKASEPLTHIEQRLLMLMPAWVRKSGAIPRNDNYAMGTLAEYDMQLDSYVMVTLTPPDKDSFDLTLFDLETRTMKMAKETLVRVFSSSGKSCIADRIGALKYGLLFDSAQLFRLMNKKTSLELIVMYHGHLIGVYALSVRTSCFGDGDIYDDLVGKLIQ